MSNLDLSRGELPHGARGSVFMVPFSDFESFESTSGFESSDSEFFQDSVTKRRRHAVYYHRPPVWYPAHQTGSPSSASGGCSSGCSGQMCGECVAAHAGNMQEDTYSCIVDCCDATAALAMTLAGTETEASSQSDQQTGLPSKTYRSLGSADKHTSSDRRVPSEKPRPSRVLLQSSVRQKGMGLYTGLQSYKDTRLGLGEKWEIHEGSLVICLDPVYTILDHDKPRLDEFELVSGDIFVICRLYADLWALCAKASSVRPESGPISPMRLAFIPLCAVTLAANFSAFTSRCTGYTGCEPDELRYPGNGLPVMPPPRSYSLSDSKQVYRGNRRHIAFPEVVYDTFNRVSLDCMDVEFVPTDPLPLETVFSNLTDRGSRRLHRLGNRMSLQKLWNGPKPLAIRDTENRSFLSTRRKQSERNSHEEQRSFSRTQRLRNLVRVVR
ncbi:hypothetical protein BO70DRAFT_370172 [Aspergillus heteromorphus CBS 117.55]|uniref:Uncharacterized protein n=1 Tax=Aspergillus heteromorphus CBS 117.55 TaxID=1448321 RepID=A0A317WHZ0_9EURO|nr:uncharacterized protein BO70DRAFT_370172 [Aspergillus heteromorphus CBS 117.55]PWY86104.1 hypothetical protein BO70DRAFT_370172 [Aspergillus heteromorphus CBS 117.55]